MQLLDWVKALEYRDSKARGEQVLAILKGMGIEPVVQECRFLKIRNIIVDFSKNPERKKLLFSAHYDAVKGSPAANDNASGVAVLLGLCQVLKDGQAPVRVVFFDREEAWLRTQVFRLGLLGSLYYVLRNSLRDIKAVYNVEFCGMGGFLYIWPVRDKETGLPAFKAVEMAANHLALPFGFAHVPWTLLSSDHLSFRFRGLDNALSLSLLPANAILELGKLKVKTSPPGLLSVKRAGMPEPLSFIHSEQDTSSRLDENSLRLMLSLLREIVKCTEDQLSGR